MLKLKGRTLKRTGVTSIGGKKDKQRRSANQFSKNNSSSFDVKGRQIFDRGKTNETNGNGSMVPSDRRKYTVLRITVVNHGRNQSSGEPKMLSAVHGVKDENAELFRATSQNNSQDIMTETSLNDLYSDKALSDGRQPLSAGDTHGLPLSKEVTESSSEKPGKFQDQSDSNVLLEAKLNPLRIGIRLDDDAKKESETSSKEVDNVSLQEVLNDIDYTTKAANVTPEETGSEKEDTVIVGLNNSGKNASHSNMEQPHVDQNEQNEGNLDKLHIKASSEKQNKNGTEVNTAGVSITTESRGLQTDGLMKVLLSKLLGSDVTEALKDKSVQKFKPASKPKSPNESQPSISLDMASTTPTGTAVESPPGTVQGVDAAEMNNKGGDTMDIEPPQTVATSPQCFGEDSQPLLLNSEGPKAPGNIRLPGGRDCHYGMEKLPTTNEASSSPTGIVVESTPGAHQAVGTGIPPPVETPNPPPRVPSTEEFASTTPTGISVESPPGTIQAVGTSIPEEGVSEMAGDKGKIKW